MECNICAERFNKSSHKSIECPKCNYSACRECVVKYMDDLHVHMRCMNCNEPWSREFLRDNMTKKFIQKEYKNHLQKIYFEQEISTISKYIPLLESKNNLSSYQNEISKNLKTIKELKQRNSELRVQCQTEKTFISKFSSNENIRPCFIKCKCPLKNCNGLVSNNWSCVSCNTKVCQSCMEIMNENHECNKEILESIKMIRNDTKPCPSCGIRVFRIEGCYQMWCTSCNTAFDWGRGNIISNHQNFHNPHYTQYIRNNRPANIQNSYTRIENCKYFSTAIKNRLHHIIRIMNEKIDLINRKNLDSLLNKSIIEIKLRYLKNEFDKDELKSKIEKTYSSHFYTKNFNNIIINYCNKVIEFIENFTINAPTCKNINSFPQLIEEIGNEFISKLNKLNDCYGKLLFNKPMNQILKFENTQIETN